MKVVFIGQYNSGKSTIISALTGDEAIHIDSNVATDRCTDYRWNNIKITDTPGIMAGKVEEHDELTRKALIDSDLMVYVLTSSLFDDLLFENFIRLAYEENFKDKMLIVVNKMSLEGGKFEDLRSHYLSSLQEDFSARGYEFDSDVLFMDALEYSEGCRDKKHGRERVEESRFPGFIEALNTFVREKGHLRKTFDTPVRMMKEELDEFVLTELKPYPKKEIQSQLVPALKKYEKDLIRHVNQLKKSGREIFKATAGIDNFWESSYFPQIEDIFSGMRPERNKMESSDFQSELTSIIMDRANLLNGERKDLISRLASFIREESDKLKTNNEIFDKVSSVTDQDSDEIEMLLSEVICDSVSKVVTNPLFRSFIESDSGEESIGLPSDISEYLEVMTGLNDSIELFECEVEGCEDILSEYKDILSESEDILFGEKNTNSESVFMPGKLNNEERSILLITEEIIDDYAVNFLNKRWDFFTKRIKMKAKRTGTRKKRNLKSIREEVSKLKQEFSGFLKEIKK